MPIINDKVIISPAQGLLLLISHYQNEIQTISENSFESNEIATVSEESIEDTEEINRQKQLQKEEAIANLELQLNEIKELFLNGANNETNASKMQYYLQIIPSIPNFDDVYEITLNPRIIDKDPVRRYFETHLAYETVLSNIDDLNFEYLQDLFTALQNPLDEFKKINKVIREDLNNFNRLKTAFSDYYDILEQLKKFTPLTAEETRIINKIQYLISDLPHFYKTMIYSAYKLLGNEIYKFMLPESKVEIIDIMSDFFQNKISNITCLYDMQLLNQLKEKIKFGLAPDKQEEIDQAFDLVANIMHEKHNKYSESLKKAITEVDTLIPENTFGRNLRNFTDIPGNIQIISEYSDLFAKLNKRILFSADNLSDENYQKLTILAQYCLYIVLYSYSGIELPLSIYGEGIFTDENRGKVKRMPSENPFTYSLGILKDYSPLPGNDIVYSESIATYLRPSVSSNWKHNKLWTEYNFSRVMHPFVNSISGSMLLHTRVIAFLQEGNSTARILELFEKIPHLKNTVDLNLIINSLNTQNLNAQEIFKIWRIVISLLLYHSGGHSLYEFISPFQLRQYRAQFHDFPELENIDLTSMFLIDNEQAFENALQDSINYNVAILNRQKVQLSLQTRQQDISLESDSQQISQEVQETIEHQEQDNIDDYIRNDSFDDDLISLADDDLISLADDDLRDDDLSSVKSSAAFDEHDTGIENITEEQDEDDIEDTFSIGDVSIDLGRNNLLQITETIEQYLDTQPEYQQIIADKQMTLLQQQSFFSESKTQEHEDYNRQIVIALSAICDELYNEQLLQADENLTNFNMIVATYTNPSAELLELSNYLNKIIPTLLEQPILASRHVKYE